MVNGAFHFSARAGDFRLQRRDPRLQLGDRERIEVLPGKLGQRVVRAARQQLVCIHRRIVDRTGGAVNKSRANFAVNRG